MSLVSRAMAYALACAGNGPDAAVEIRIRRAVFAAPTGRGRETAPMVRWLGAALVNDREIARVTGEAQTAVAEELVAKLKQMAAEHVLHLQRVLGQPTGAEGEELAR
ncbi:MAG TPA: hypothetical protein VF765_31260 [Polyangiaceae bacterium]